MVLLLVLLLLAVLAVLAVALPLGPGLDFFMKEELRREELAGQWAAYEIYH